ncbi:hypothetical protein SAMN05421869_1114 [Nonomuraea jiangxiensis]|uniref:Uncharacterized protein n=1 Tax=Nonomuraea jiangxiensis TaxID=633440 RepID=A0A1G8UJH4_9ACTN|nr:hypothetical protein SAMN05421869_1114 [Nonomuraea jiangxiensis]
MADTGPAAGIVYVILSAIGFFGLVEWIRKRWNIRTGQPGERTRE